MNIQHPSKRIVPIAAGLAWRADGAIYQEKLDGEFATLAVSHGGRAGGILIGEAPRLVTRHSSLVTFTAFDCGVYDGREVLGLPAFERCKMRDELCRRYGVPIVPESTHGASLLRAVIARGGEGVVRKRPDAPYSSAMEAAKAIGQWRCEVVAIGSSSAEVRDCATGEARGRVPLRGGKIERIRLGSLLKIEGLELTARGLIRDPRPCQDAADSWLIAY